MRNLHLQHAALWSASLAVAVLASGVAADEARPSARERSRASGAAPPVVIEPFQAGRPHRQPTTPTSAQPEGAPDWKRIEQIVSEHFEGLRDYQPGDIVARGDVEPLGRKLNAAGWQPEDWKAIVADVLPENDELVRALRTPRGRAFMRKTASLPGGYDGMDKLRALPNGARQLRDLIDTPGGEKLIEYMTSTEGGKHLTRELEQKQSPAAAKAAAKRIYTEADLLKRLQASYQKATDPRGPDAGSQPLARPPL